MIDYRIAAPILTFIIGYLIGRLFVRTDRAEKKMGERDAKTTDAGQRPSVKQPEDARWNYIRRV